MKHAKAHKEDKAAAAAAGGGDGAGGGADNAATGAAANNAATGTAAAAAATAGAGAGAVAAAVAALDDTGTGTDSSGGAGAGGGAGASSAIGETAGLSGAGGGAGVVARTSDDTVYTGVLSADFDPTTFDTTRAVHVSKEPAVAPSQLRYAPCVVVRRVSHVCKAFSHFPRHFAPTAAGQPFAHAWSLRHLLIAWHRLCHGPWHAFVLLTRALLRQCTS